MDPLRLSKLFAGLVKRAGIADGHLHILRHTFASNLLALNVHPKVASEMLGHSSTAITLGIYSHTRPSLQRDAARQLYGVLCCVLGFQERAADRGGLTLMLSDCCQNAWCKSAEDLRGIKQ